MSFSAFSVPSALAIDVGGTFTDVVAAWPNKQIRTTKFLSSVCADPSALAAHLTNWLSGLGEQNGGSLPSITRINHASTVATNALLEGQVSATALITTRGFRDVLELARGIRPEPLDLTWRPLPAVVPRHLRLTVLERMGSDGTVVHALEWDDERCERILDDIGQCDAVAICLLNSYANPAHEKQIAAALLERRPSLFVSCSHEVNPEPREYERTSTTAINAALGPVVRHYLEQLESAFASMGLDDPIAVMQSNGGTLTSSLVKTRPVSIVESGPAAGVLATLGIARHLNEPRVIALDIGGTTAKASLIENFEILEAPEYYVGGGMHAGPRAATNSGYVIRMPSLDIAEVGAGGGSIAYVDEANGLHVGPRSAGASPGPAAYGLGGADATVTDSDIVLGYVNPRSIANGQQRIDLKRAREAIERTIANPRKLSAEDAALVIHAGANARILAALRSVTIERGRDPRDHLIVAFGGCGPVHACGIAELLGVSRIFVPFGAGVLSAAGLLAASPAADIAESRNQSVDDVQRAEITARFAELRDQMRSHYELSSEDIAAAQPLVCMRYAGQSEVYVPMPSTGDLASELRQAFEREYAAEFGFTVPSSRCEVVGLRLRLRRPPAADWSVVLEGLGETWLDGPGALPPRFRHCVFDQFRGDCPVVSLDRVATSPDGVAGPAILETPDTTVVIAAGWRAVRHQKIGILLCK